MGHVVANRVKNIQAYSFVAVFCMNFIIFLCVTLKLFSLSFVPLLASSPGDAIVVNRMLLVLERRQILSHQSAEWL